jgi:hypothetical protein
VAEVRVRPSPALLTLIIAATWDIDLLIDIERLQKVYESLGFWPPAKSTLYTHVKWLARLGFINIWRDEKGKKYAELTRQSERLLRELNISKYYVAKNTRVLLGVV